MQLGHRTDGAFTVWAAPQLARASATLRPLIRQQHLRAGGHGIENGAGGKGAGRDDRARRSGRASVRGIDHRARPEWEGAGGPRDETTEVHARGQCGVDRASVRDGCSQRADNVLGPWPPLQPPASGDPLLLGLPAPPPTPTPAELREPSSVLVSIEPSQAREFDPTPIRRLAANAANKQTLYAQVC